MTKNKKFNEFLESIKDVNPTLIESIMQGYEIIHESSINKVNQIKDTLGEPEPDPDQLLDDEPTEINPEQDPTQEYPNI